MRFWEWLGRQFVGVVVVSETLCVRALGWCGVLHERT